jgi:hypothetical protein
MTVNITLDTTDLLDAADRLATLDAQTLREIREATVDVVTLSVRKAAIAETVKQLNLTPAYVDERIQRRRGKREVLTTSESLISEVEGATLQRFGAERGEKPVTWSNARIQGMGLKFSKWPGWTERKGDKSRGIAPDFKADGVWVNVNRKADKNISGAFTMPLKKGKEAGGNGFGVFRRPKGGGDPVHLYGPSVYQVFRRYAQEKEADIMAELQDNFLSRLDTQLSKI